MKKISVTVFLSSFAALVAAIAGIYAYGGLYAINTVLHGGPTRWLTMKADDPRLPLQIRWALAGQAPVAVAGPFAWQQMEPGLDVAEMPVMANGVEADSILLTRIDTTKFKFEFLSAPSGIHDLAGWMRALKPVAMINGSYFSKDGKPDTPFLSDGKLVSVRNDPPAQGGFVITSAAAEVETLPNGNWVRAFRGAESALATYPLLIGPNGSNTGIRESHWVANRSFAGEDADGQIILGTTTRAFFSLNRFAAFLYSAPLGLKMALNLDGGPVACQAINMPNYKRQFCGEWEIRDHGGWFKVLKMPPGSWIPLPVVIAVYRK